MTMTEAEAMSRGAVIEEPRFFPPDAQTYFGFVSRPSSGPASSTGVVLLGGTQPGCTTIGRNRLWVTLARDIAGAGHPTIRFDYPGLGESLGGSVEYDLDRPAVEVLRAAMAELAEGGVERFVLIGTCYGSRTALAVAADDTRVDRLVLLAPPPRHITKGRGGTSHIAQYASGGELARKAVNKRSLRRLATSRTARRNAWRVASMAAKARLGGAKAGGPSRNAEAFEAAEGFLTPLRALTGRGVPVRIVFGEDDYLWAQFQKAAEGRLGKLLGQAGDLVEVEVVPGVVRGLVTLDVQERVRAEALAAVARASA